MRYGLTQAKRRFDKSLSLFYYTLPDEVTSPSTKSKELFGLVAGP